MLVYPIVPTTDHRKGQAMTTDFLFCRTHSVTRPTLAAGMLICTGSFNRATLEAFTAEDIGFYRDERLMRLRGEERHTERFMFQASHSLDGPWEDIKLIVPLPGDPDDMFDEEDDDRWGQCLRCKRNLTESEAALNDVCEGCRPQVYEEWQNDQDRLAEEGEEARRSPEASDDEMCYYCAGVCSGNCPDAREREYWELAGYPPD